MVTEKGLQLFKKSRRHVTVFQEVFFQGGLHEQWAWDPFSMKKKKEQQLRTLIPSCQFPTLVKTRECSLLPVTPHTLKPSWAHPPKGSTPEASAPVTYQLLFSSHFSRILSFPEPWEIFQFWSRATSPSPKPLIVQFNSDIHCIPLRAWYFRAESQEELFLCDFRSVTSVPGGEAQLTTLLFAQEQGKNGNRKRGNTSEFTALKCDGETYVHKYS